MEEEPIKQESPEVPALPEEREEQTESFQSLIRGKYREDYLASSHRWRSPCCSRRKA